VEELRLHAAQVLHKASNDGSLQKNLAWRRSTTQANMSQLDQLQAEAKADVVTFGNKADLDAVREEVAEVEVAEVKADVATPGNKADIDAVRKQVAEALLVAAENGELERSLAPFVTTGKNT